MDTMNTSDISDMSNIAVVNNDIEEKIIFLIDVYTEINRLETEAKNCYYTLKYLDQLCMIRNSTKNAISFEKSNQNKIQIAVRNNSK